MQQRWGCLNTGQICAAGCHGRHPVERSLLQLASKKTARTGSDACHPFAGMNVLPSAAERKNRI
jgi:hypothetical protein